METVLVRKSQEFAEQLLSRLPEKFAYHNLWHTKEVVKAAEEIGRNSNLSDDEMETLLIAAWLHDTGYKNGCEGHEAFSAAEAVQLLTSWGASAKKIEAVRQAIEATRMPQHPKSMVEEVLCDADLYHLSDEHLLKDSEKLRREWQVTQNKNFSDNEWAANNLAFLKSHQYFTPYAKSVLEDRKKRNIKKLKDLLKSTEEDHLNDFEKSDKKKKKKDKHKKPERGIETMFRIASENNMKLSDMADTKANIMISVNSIILSLVVTVLFRKLDAYPNLLIPILMLVTISLLTIIFAIKATRPNVTSGKFTRDDINTRKTNLLFFGNFHRMDLNQYDWGMREMMKDGDFLYGSLIKDIYFSGKVLAKKYRALRISYSIFMYGFATSIIAFIVALLIYYNPH